jgi:limonene-1,2-epoxide hydrolase
VGAEQEQVVLAFLRCTEGREQDVDGLVALMAEDIVWQINVPAWMPRVGLAASRAEIERQNTMSTGILSGSEVVNIVSNDRVVFTERVDVFEMGTKRIALRINGVFEVTGGKVSAWREYYDSVDLARQLGVEPRFVVEA